VNRGLTPLQRLRLSGISPERALGQNFLIDPNILDVIERSASLGADDIVLEVGPGLGVLTERLIERCALVHCIETDKRLISQLKEEFGGREARFRLYQADAMKFDLSRLDPPPRKFVSNLPYNVAAPLIMKSLQELPEVSLWCLMVQKEIADRLFAATGSANYGGLSVMLRLMCERISSRTISGAVFIPRPRVRSSLLVFKRRPGDATRGQDLSSLKEIVYASFSHRRKTLVNSLADADPSPAALRRLQPGDRKQLIERQLDIMGLPSNVRPQAINPRQFERLAGMLVEAGGHADA
jgi:16S rRNA (adenine1518-N6/adenine1519-N6)-dimethyltransferase